MSRAILGISAYYHDSAAALLVDGKLVAAAQEERFSRRKHDPGFPSQAVAWCLSHADLPLQQLDSVVFYDKPFLTFDRLLETAFSHAPRGMRSFIQRMPVWLKQKLLLKKQLRQALCELAGCKVADLPPLLFTTHHQAHAASAFFPSPFQKAAVLCMDGVGEWATTSAWLGEDNQLQALWQLDFPDSLGLLYSAFTYFCGFRVNSGEYKLMGLAPYGKPRYQRLIEDKLIDIRPDGSFRLDLDYFDYVIGETMTNNKFATLFDGPPRQPETPITQRECDLAASIQAVTETVVMRLAKTLKIETGASTLCLAGGVALNSVANGKLAASGLFEKLWIQPAAGDAGGAVGAALMAWHGYYDQPRAPSADDSMPDLMKAALLGPAFTGEVIQQLLDTEQAVYTKLDDASLISTTAELLHQGNIIGWFQGKMEFGPRALGNRSILADPTRVDMQRRLNQKIKFRESFRPFAPSVTCEAAERYFGLENQQPLADSPYMLVVGQVKPDWLLEEQVTYEPDDNDFSLLQQLNTLRSQLPAVTHVDNSARVQTVNATDNPRYHALLTAFEQLSGHPVLVNTSFNVRGEPIVCSPRDAWSCFMTTDMDYLVIGNCLLDKRKQPAIDCSALRPATLELD